MKPLYVKYETGKLQALLLFNLVALLASTEAELQASELDRLCVRLVRPKISGALLLSAKNMAGNYVTTEGDEVSVHLNLPKGRNRVTVEAEFGTNTRTLAIVDVFTSGDEDGVFEPEAITTPVVKQLTDVSREEFEELKRVAANAKSVTYAELKEARDNGELVAGQAYRITDYVATVANDAEARSAGHTFDVIVVATDADKLGEQAMAALHEGDEYFAGCKLEAWRLMYCIDNDTDRFAWADEENGKGVIWRMVDEWNNDLPFDFKGIQFKRWAVTDVKKGEDSIENADVFIYDAGSQDVRYGTQGENYSQGNLTYEVDEDDAAFYYAFSWVTEDGEIEDASIVAQNFNGDEGFPYGVHDNKQLCSTLMYDERADEKLLFALPNNVIVATYSYEDGMFYGIYSNTFGNYCYSNTFGNYCFSNTFGNYCNYNTFGNSCYSNTFGNYCNYNTFGNSCYSNTFGNSCYSNTFGNECFSNTFGEGAGNNAVTKDYMRYVMLENGVKYVNVSCDDTTSSSTYGQNILVHAGVEGTSQTRKTCEIADAGNAFLTEFGTVQQGAIS